MIFLWGLGHWRKETHIYKETADRRCLVFSTTFNKKLSSIRQCFDVLIRPRTLTVKKPIYTRRKLIQDVLSFPHNKKLSNIRQCFDVLIRPRTLTVKKPIYTRRKLIQDVYSYPRTFNKKLSNIRQCFDVLIRPRTLTVKKPIYTRRKLIQDVLSYPQQSIKSYQILGNVLIFLWGLGHWRKETHIYKETADRRCLVFSTTFNKKLWSVRQCFDVLIRPRTLTVKKPIYTRRKLIQDVLSYPQLSIKNYQILGNVLMF